MLTDQEIAARVADRLVGVELTLSTLLEMMNRCTVGSSPTHIVCGYTAYNKLTMLIAMVMGSRVDTFMFNGAELQYNTYLPDDEIIILNSRHPSDPQLNLIIRVI